MVMKIGDVSWGFPADDWPAWTVCKDIESEADDLAGRFADGPAAQAVVRRSVVAVNADALAKKGVIVRQAIWVPDRSTGEGMAMLDTLVWGFPKGADPSAEAFQARRNLKKDMGRGSKIFDYHTSLTDVPAGRSVTEVYTIRMRHEAIIQGYILFSIFPEGSANALCLQVSTVHLDLIKNLCEQMRIIAESVEIALWDAPE